MAGEPFDDFDAFFRVVYPKARNAVARFARDLAAAEDAAAEACARALAHWERIGHLPHREAWVIRVCCNVAVDEDRRRARWSGPRKRARLTPRDVADETASRLTLLAAAKRLPKRQREAVILRHLVGLPEADVAAALGISANTVKTHADRGLAVLRSSLSEATAAMEVPVVSA